MLLEKNPSKWLGAKNGFKEIKEDFWFSSVNWAQVENKEYEME